MTPYPIRGVPPLYPLIKYNLLNTESFTNDYVEVDATDLIV